MRRVVGAALALLAASAGADYVAPGYYASGYFEDGYFAASSPDVTVPDVLGDDESTATAAIEAEGLVVGSVNNQCSDVMSGLVVDQNPDGGATVAAGSTVSLWLSSGVACGSGRPPLWLFLEIQR